MKRRYWTIKEQQFVKSFYAEKGPKWIAQRIDRTVSAVQQYANKMGLKYKGPVGFRPGSTPWNKGLKGFKPHNSTKGYFKPGNLPATTKPAGKPYKRKDHGKEYYFIRPKGHRRATMLHVYLWEQANGPVPEGHICVFKDGNTLNCTLENIECITRAENMRRNHGKTNRRRAALKAWKTRDRKMRQRLGLPARKAVI
jgi:hypothetical protein